MMTSNAAKSLTVASTENRQTVRGKAIFCLHDLDCSWFQGHFLPLNDILSSLGLLAVNRIDVDECLQCRDGGYREVDLRIVSSQTNKTRRTNNGSNNRVYTQRSAEEKKKLNVERVVCTGGDMIRMKSDDTAVTFEAERVITGVKVVPLVERYFKSLLKSARKLGAHDDEEKKDDMGEASVLELLPHCAVVIGSMELNLPRSFLSNENDSSDEENEDWISR